MLQISGMTRRTTLLLGIGSVVAVSLVLLSRQRTGSSLSIGNDALGGNENENSNASMETVEENEVGADGDATMAQEPNPFGVRGRQDEDRQKDEFRVAETVGDAVEQEVESTREDGLATVAQDDIAATGETVPAEVKDNTSEHKQLTLSETVPPEAEAMGVEGEDLRKHEADMLMEEADERSDEEKLGVMAAVPEQAEVNMGEVNSNEEEQKHAEEEESEQLDKVEIVSDYVKKFDTSVTDETEASDEGLQTNIGEPVTMREKPKTPKEKPEAPREEEPETPKAEAKETKRRLKMKWPSMKWRSKNQNMVQSRKLRRKSVN